MTALRIADILIWSITAIFMARGALAATTGCGTRYGDPMRLACFATAIVVVGFNARWIFAAESILIWKLLYALSGAVGIYIVVLGRRYGRGPKL